MIITIASGKGGTGKTTFAVNLAYALGARGENIRLLDCDVEEPNDHLFVRPVFTAHHTVNVKKPVWHQERCVGCGKCAKACHYNALAVIRGKVLVFNELCHSCGVCAYVCPKGALTETDASIGIVQAAPGHEPFYFAQGVLNVGEALAPGVVRAVKAHADPEAIDILDAPPGTACPVVEAVGGADAVLLVTEPTPFGLHDLKLAVALSLKLRVPTGVVVNRSDGRDEMIEDYCDRVGVPVAGRIPYRREYAEAYAEGKILVEHFPELRENLLEIYDNLAAAQPPPPAEEGFDKLPAAQDQPFAEGSATSYREVTVISGKGGTGKTTVVGAFAHLAEENVLADNDVDAADLHLLLAPVVREAHDFIGGAKAAIDPGSCVQCGKCAEACHFGAVRVEASDADGGGRVYRIEPMACEGCGLCRLVCPARAIRDEACVTGRWYVSSTARGPMVHARLGIAEENSGRLVTQVRDRAARLAAELKQASITADGPPGTGCPVIASVSGTDLVVIVTEPTVAGVHDMERVLKLSAHFGVPAAVIVNKADLNEAQARRIDALACTYRAEVIGRIPFDRAVHEALMEGKTIIEYGLDLRRSGRSAGPGGAEEAVRNAWSRLRCLLQGDRADQNGEQQ